MKSRLGGALLLLFASVGGAQSPPEHSQWQDLLDRSRSAINDLHYGLADTLARDVLNLGSRAPRAARAQALELVAAANFPEQETERHVAEARTALAQLLRLDLEARVPRELSWPGLDSLMREVSRTTYAISVVVRRENPIVGLNGTAPIRVRANRGSMLILSARSRDGIESMVLDSAYAATDTNLSLRVARDGKPLLRSGDYEFVVIARDLQTNETLTRTFDGVANVAPVDYVPVPASVDSSALRPEHGTPQRVQEVLGAVLIGASTFALGKNLRSEGDIRDAGESDRRYVTIGTVMTLATGLAAYFDHGRLLDKNRAANRKLIADFRSKQRAAVAENERRTAQYKASIILNPEAR